MIIVTSLAPGHTNADNQAHAIKSWQPYGHCYSMNTENEIKIIDSYDNIRFVPTYKNVFALIGKPLVSINSMIDFAIEKKEDLLLINSDIILGSLPEFKDDGITIASRYDYAKELEDSKKFEYGFDVFYIPNKFLTIFPPAIYALGMAWFDYWLPYRIILNNIPLYYLDGKYAYHKLHPTQYSVDEWVHIGRYFQWEFRLNPQLNVEQVATAALLNIKSRLRKNWQ